MKQLLQTAAGILGGILLLTGCSNVAVFNYSDTAGTMLKLSGAERKSTVAVLPMTDRRAVKYADPALAAEAERHPSGDHGSFYYGFIPLMPIGFVEKEEPENSTDFVSLGRFQFNPVPDLTAAEFQSLSYSGLFANVTRANSAAQTDADYLWRGNINLICYRGGFLTYGITYFFAPGLWALCIPSGYSANELWVDFALVKRTTGEQVWNYSYRGSDFLTHWLYLRVGDDVSLYPQLMKEAMNRALYELNRQHPQL